MVSSGIVLGYTHTHPLVIKREATKIPWLIGLFLGVLHWDLW